MANHPAALPHGDIEEVFSDIFMVRGSFKPGFGVRFDRSMTIIRTGGELVAINSVRLTDAGEAELARLGKLAHVIRLGVFHGADDPYYVERFGATLWGPPGMRHAGPARDLSATDRPLEAELFPFANAKKPEAALVLPQDGGVLVTCDSYQNWTTFEHCSWLARVFLKRMKFGPAMIGGAPWIKGMGRGVRADLEQLATKSFRHLVPGHGAPLRDVAQTKLGDAIRARFD